MSVILGLDLSLVRSGIAVLTDGVPTLVRSVGHEGVAGANYRHRSRRITSQCQAVIHAIDPWDGALPANIDIAIIEAQLEGGPMLPSALDRSALWWGVYSALASRRIPTAVVHPMTLKVWTTGKGRADKADMLAAVRAWGWTPTNHDEADALALASVGAYHLGDPVPFMAKDRHTSTLEKVDWPVSA
jgi:Holliday junction resolvasome RuvABC endonuclease subunit